MLKSEIQEVANKLYRKYNTLNPYKLCNELGYELIFDDKMPTKLRGTTREILRTKFILINANLNSVDKNNACLHEIGHNVLKHDDNVLFHQSSTLQVISKEENEANLFLIHYLLAQYTPMDLHCLTKDQIADMIGVERNLMNLL